jgi:hypothetical protein
MVFWLLDSDRVMVETFSAELNLAQPQEIELYSGIFDQMTAVASYGRSARATKPPPDMSWPRFAGCRHGRRPEVSSAPPTRSGSRPVGICLAL